MRIARVSLLAHGVFAFLAPESKIQARYDGLHNYSIPNAYVVYLHPLHTIGDHFSNIGLNVTEHATRFFYLPSSNVYYATIPNATIVHELIRRDSGVEKVGHDSIIHLPEQPRRQRPSRRKTLSPNLQTAVRILGKRAFNWVNRPTSWWWQMMSSYDRLPTPVATLHPQTPVVMEGAGAGVNVFVFDTGVKQHGQLWGRVSNLNNLADNAPSPYCPGETVADNRGHGTYIAGLIAGTSIGMANGANIVSVKVTCDSGQIIQAELTKAINAVTDAHLLALQQATLQPQQQPKYQGAVINIAFSSPNDPNRDYDDFKTALQRAFDAGIPIFVAAGNYNKDASEFIPAAWPMTFVVGSVDRSYNIATNPPSCYGPRVSVFAPGSNILGPNYNRDNFADVDQEESGTSNSVAFVSGFAATVIGYEGPRGRVTSTQYVYDQVVLNSRPNMVSPKTLPKDTTTNLLTTGVRHPLRRPEDPYFI